MTKLKFDTFKQFQIFFVLMNNPKGLERVEISKRLCLPRTTVYDNLKILFIRTINHIPYIHYYFYRNYQKGRPKVIYYIPKGIKDLFINDSTIPDIIVKQTLEQYQQEIKNLYFKF